MVAPYKLLSKTIGETVDEAAEKFGDNESLVFSNDNIRMTFVQLKEKVSYVSCYTILFNGTTVFSLNVFLLLLIFKPQILFFNPLQVKANLKVLGQLNWMIHTI